MYAIIQEGEEQAEQPSEAAYMYQDSGFRARRAFAEWFADRYWIATAEHSLTRPNSVIQPYQTDVAELESNSFPDRTARSWSREAWLMLHAESGKWINCEELVILADEQYVDLLERALESVRDCGVGDVDVSTPFVDVTDSEERRHWIDERLSEAGAFA